jgi:2Fe-2S ferredoxin
LGKTLTVGSLRGNSNTVNSFERPYHLNKQTNQVRFSQTGEVYELKLSQIKKKSLLDAALNCSLPLSYKCKKGKCRKCNVTIHTGVELFNNPTENEINKIGSDPYIERLSCQTFLKN